MLVEERKFHQRKRTGQNKEGSEGKGGGRMEAPSTRPKEMGSSRNNAKAGQKGKVVRRRSFAKRASSLGYRQKGNGIQGPKN